MKPVEIGETNRYGWEIKSSIPNDTITNVSATWKLFAPDGTEVTFNASDKICTVTDNKYVYALVPFTDISMEQGLYILELTVMIPPETKIERLPIEVIR